MSRKIKDTDYLGISARIKAMENSLLSEGRMEQLLTARTEEEVLHLLQDCGYPPFSLEHPEEMDRALTQVQEETLQDLKGGIPDRGYLEIFQTKHDYHNVKALLKAAQVHTDAASMLMDLGRVPAEELKEALQTGEVGNLPAILAETAAEAKNVLETTRDPQLSDMVLDRGYYRDLLETARRTGSAFLTGYVQVMIDAANLRAVVRTLRMGKTAEFLKNVLFDGGSVSTDALLTAVMTGGTGFTELYASSPLQDAAETGGKAVSGGPLTEFEKLCDDAVEEYLSGAQLIPFGEAPLVAYLAAKETETVNLRILLMGRKAGLSPEVIRSRLRASYV